MLENVSRGPSRGVQRSPGPLPLQGCRGSTPIQSCSPQHVLGPSVGVDNTRVPPRYPQVPPQLWGHPVIARFRPRSRARGPGWGRTEGMGLGSRPHPAGIGSGPCKSPACVLRGGPEVPPLCHPLPEHGLCHHTGHGERAAAPGGSGDTRRSGGSRAPVGGLPHVPPTFGCCPARAQLRQHPEAARMGRVPPDGVRWGRGWGSPLRPRGGESGPGGAPACRAVPCRGVLHLAFPCRAMP